MEHNDPILATLTGLFREVLGNDSLTLARSTTAAQVDGWDSLAHVTLMLSVQQAFGIRLSASESSRLSGVGALIDLIRAKSVTAGGTRLPGT